MNWYLITIWDGVNAYQKLIQANSLAEAANMAKGADVRQIYQMNFPVDTKDPFGPCFFCSYQDIEGNIISTYSFEASFLAAYENVSRLGTVKSIRETTFTLDNK